MNKALAEALYKANARVIPLGLYQSHTLKGKYGNPDIDEGFVVLIQCGSSDTADSSAGDWNEKGVIL